MPNLRLATFLSLLIFQYPLGSYASDEIPLEYQVKAVYLFNLTSFVTWPDQGQSSSSTVCVLGENPFGDYLNFIETKKAKERSINVEMISSFEQSKNCDLVFIPKGTPKELWANQLFERTDLLTVGEGDEFIQSGGMIALVLVGSQVKVSVDLKQTRTKGFQISGNLLEVCHKVYQ